MGVKPDVMPSLMERVQLVTLQTGVLQLLAIQTGSTVTTTRPMGVKPDVLPSLMERVQLVTLQTGVLQLLAIQTGLIPTIML